ncbi:MAG: hypothetical protein ACLPVI_07975 [Dehalococcoidales bacterium]
MKSFRAFIQNNRIAIYSVAYLIGIVIADIVIHEIGHLLAALFSGVPINKIGIIFTGINPGLKLPDGLSSGSLLFIDYAGGFFAAVVSAIFYFVVLYRRYRVKPSLLVWIMGLITFGMVGDEVGNGIVEGHFHTLYMTTASSAFSTVNLMITLFAGAGLLLHVLLFPL